MLKEIIKSIIGEQQERAEKEVPKGLKNAIEDIQEKIKKEHNSDILHGVASAEKMFKGVFGDVYEINMEFTSIEFKEEGIKVIEGEVKSIIEIIE